MAKTDAKKLMGKTTAPGLSAFEKTDTVVVDRREQRKRDQAAGLVPFAVKLNSALVLQLQAAAKEKNVDLNTLVGDLLAAALAG
ncbi:hypothetical protein RCH09_003015 [Actimicrobium sp. GrIS 1.19]|uniref:hypothetical protein n=1 Tax=Actimicrobium sp. GrIS 1.19 TaxID=3071708 RepID=UPI002E04148A|nr:hypothetical protein [Actimicrobium sp. GrIS 1.19]